MDQWENVMNRQRVSNGTSRLVPDRIRQWFKSCIYILLCTQTNGLCLYIDYIDVPLVGGMARLDCDRRKLNVRI